MTESVPVQSAKITLEIAQEVCELGGAGVSELSERLDKPTSTVYDHLRTLEQQGYLVKEGDEYMISTRFLELGDKARLQQKVYRTARPEVDDLADQTGQHANLMIEEHGYGVFLYRSRGADAVSLDTHAGKHVHLQTTALGKAILANRPREEVDSILDRHGLPQITEQTITDQSNLYEELEEVRSRGYAYDDEERIKGIRCVSAPILNRNGRSIAAISVSGPKRRISQDRFTKDLPEMVQGAANVIEVNITHS